MLEEESDTEGMAVVSCWYCKGCCREDGVDTPPTPKVVPEAVGDEEVPMFLLGIASTYLSIIFLSSNV
jgi:hypothetical protein